MFLCGVPLRGAKTQRVFIPAFVLSPIRFYPIPNSGRRNSGMAGRAPPYGGLPCGGENPAGFHPCFSHPFVKPLPILAERAAGWQSEHPLTAAVLPLRGRNAAVRGCSDCRDDAGLGRDKYKRDKR
ncbi:MAG: hypothetical protein LBK61_14410 [Spirochaetaceae bacterium]|nr:hypothetical protein [Spirochaetaceae bacterium]